MKIYSNTRSFNADTYTPVQLYLQIRNNFRNCCLLESNDYNSRKDSRSFIGFDPLINFELYEQLIIRKGTEEEKVELNSELPITEQIQNILEAYQFEHEQSNGFFGRMSFEYALKDETHIQPDFNNLELPLLHFFIFKHILVIDHFTNEGFLIENSLNDDFVHLKIEDIIKLPAPSNLPFELVGKEHPAFSDLEFQYMVQKAIKHCERGDVFQLVLSNSFERSFFGDDFHVYRQLRRTNPSPYLFYFDFESYRLFGSSPEAQMVIQDDRAVIHPIAGTVPKTGDQIQDEEQLNFLISDEKENAEHTMLVDLARNDLSRNCEDVRIDSYKEVQHFSHVTHLVSKVSGKLQSKNSFATIAQSFPAGTLSGTPKPKALELIDEYEKGSRSFYGGAIGILQPSGNSNMAIVIRSILSKDNSLRYQAGAGIVLDSDPERECNEVHHKLRAVRQAIIKADTLQSQTEKIQSYESCSH